MIDLVVWALLCAALVAILAITVYAPLSDYVWLRRSRRLRPRR